MRIDGQPPPAQGIEALRRRIGYVIQEGGLFPHLSAADNVTLMARHLEWEPARIASRLDELRTLARLPARALTRAPPSCRGARRNGSR